MILKWIFKNAEKCRLDSSGSRKRPREKKWGGGDVSFIKGVE
jgi:hypothetical protein